MQPAIRAPDGAGDLVKHELRPRTSPSCRSATERFAGSLPARSPHHAGRSSRQPEFASARGQTAGGPRMPAGLPDPLAMPRPRSSSGRAAVPDGQIRAGDGLAMGCTLGGPHPRNSRLPRHLMRKRRSPVRCIRVRWQAARHPARSVTHRTPHQASPQGSGVAQPPCLRRRRTETAGDRTGQPRAACAVAHSHISRRPGHCASADGRATAWPTPRIARALAVS